MRKRKENLLFALALIPVAAVAGYFTILYQLDFVDEALIEEALIEEAVAQLGSLDALVAVYIGQTVLYSLFCGFVGSLLAQRLGLWKPIRVEKRPLAVTLALSVVGGILFGLDYWTFGKWMPEIGKATAATLNWKVVIASVLYGGVVEELMLRLFLMSLMAWILWKLFFRKEEGAPTGVIIAANVMAALLFAAGHLPATAMTFGSLTPMLLIRCFLLNGGFGLLFGWLYRKFGIQYAMVSHATLHIVSKLIWFLFI